MTDEIKRQILEIRAGGLTNMFDVIEMLDAVKDSIVNQVHEDRQ